MKTQPLTGWIAAGGMVAVALGAAVMASHRPASAATSAAEARREVSGTLNRKGINAAKAELAELDRIAKSNPTPEVRAERAKAHIQVAYREAENGQWSEARTRLNAVAEEEPIKPPEEQDAAYGSLGDQAAYQAAVTYFGEGRVDEGMKALERFVSERPESPLRYSAYRRLKQNAKNEAQRKIYEEAEQLAITAHTKKLLVQAASCGPKAVDYLLRHFRKETPGVKALTEECGTTESGTPLAKMALVLNRRGIETKAYQFNYDDFSRAKTPFLWLTGSHYVVVTDVSAGTTQIFDPMRGSGMTSVPKPKDMTQFRANVLILNP